MASYKELLQQRELLEASIKEARGQEISEAVTKAKEIIQTYGLQRDDVFSSAKPQRKKGGPVLAKYKDPVTGATWTGRGIAPKWLKDKDRASFLIEV